MRILYIVTRELSYTRNDVILRAFRRFAEVDVVGFNRRRSLILRSIQCNIKAWSLINKNNYDLIFIGFYGHLLMLSMSRISNIPILFDAFLSTYDTLCFDRKIFSPTSISGQITYYLDQQACRRAWSVLLDTNQHVSFFVNTFNLSTIPFHSIPVSCNEDIFYPRKVNPAQDQLRVLYYLSFLPLHGAEVVVKAADYLRHLPITFRMIGTGPQYKKVNKLASELGLKNIEFVSDVSINQLPEEIALSNVCLGGHFGTSAKANRVIPGKIYQILAMGRPLIAANSIANQELLTHQENAWLCRPGDAVDLAESIKELYLNPSLLSKLGKASRQLFEERCNEKVVTRLLIDILYHSR